MRPAAAHFDRTIRMAAGAANRDAPPQEVAVIPHRIIAIPQAVADEVRTTRTSPRYGHPAHTEIATGHGPCRLCLRSFEVGQERRILFTYDPFQPHGVPALPGPVFIHEAPCRRRPEDAGFPPHLGEHPLTFVAYGAERRMLDEVRHPGGDVTAILDRLLRREGTLYVHVRDTTAGCFDLLVEPA